MPALDERQILLASFRSLVLEHLSAMHLLCDAGAIGSAFALYRPMLETIVRGEWLFFCADQSYCEAFMQGTHDRGHLSIVAMAREVDERLALGPRLMPHLSTFRQMSDFTHGGQKAVVPRIEAALSKACHTPSEVRLVMGQATSMAATHVSAALRASGQYQAADEIVELARALSI